MEQFDCVIIGGGIAGLQAAIQLGRYKHHVLVIDANKGRSSLCRNYHNILGYPNGISGEKLRKLGKEQAEKFHVVFWEDEVISAKKENELFLMQTKKGATVRGKRVLLSTGLVDNIPPFPALFPCLGESVYVCPDCDGYEVEKQRTVVIGNGDVGANMVITLSYWTDELIFINHGMTQVKEELLEKLKNIGAIVINKQIKEVRAEGSLVKGYLLEDDTFIEATKSFIAFGGNKVQTGLAEQLGVERLENKHLEVNPRTKETNVKNVWAAGDIVAHSEQVTIAMGEGSQAAIWIHKSLVEKV